MTVEIDTNPLTTFGNLIKQHTTAIATYAVDLEYETNVAEPDNELLHSLKHAYENEKARLTLVWDEVKQKGIEFAKELFEKVKSFFVQLASDFISWLELHALDEIIDFVKSLFD